MGHKVFLLGLGPREKTTPSGNRDNHLSRDVVTKALVVTVEVQGWLYM